MLSAAITCRYDFGKQLGKGQFGTTRLVTDKKTGEQLACKSISKRKLVSPEDIADVQREVQIMHHLAGHPNVVHMKGAYEDRHHVHIVMEVCQGGELFDRIVERGKYTERDAAAAIRTIVKVWNSRHCKDGMLICAAGESMMTHGSSSSSGNSCSAHGSCRLCCCCCCCLLAAFC